MVPWYLTGNIAPGNCIAAYQALGAANLATSYINLAHPGTYNCTAPVAAPTFASATGWTFDGLTQYLSTGIIPTGTSWTVLIRFGPAVNGIVFGCYELAGDRRFYLYPSNGPGNAAWYENGGDLWVIGGKHDLGVVGFAGKTAYYMSNVVDTIPAGTNVPGIDAFIGALNNDGTPGFYYEGDIHSVAVYNIILTPAQVIAVIDEMCAVSPIFFNPIRIGSIPILRLGAAGSWEDVDVIGPDVFWDPPNNRYVMQYSGFDGAQWHTGLAYSTNLYNWTKDPLNPVFSPDGTEGYIAADGSIVYKNGTYYFVYNNQDWNIKLATSPDLHTWTRRGIIISRGAPGSFDSLVAGDPFIRILPDGTFAVYYVGDDATTYRKIGWASSPDGLIWTKEGIFLDAGVAENLTGAPTVLQIGTSLILTCDNGTMDRKLDEYVSIDNGATWLHLPGVLAKTGTGWESAQVCDATPFQVGDKIYYFYSGAPIEGGLEGLNAQIGLATVSWNIDSVPEPIIVWVPQNVHLMQIVDGEIKISDSDGQKR